MGGNLNELLQGHLVSVKLPVFTCTVITTVLYIIVGYLAKTRLKRVKPNVTMTTASSFSSGGGAVSSNMVTIAKGEAQQRKVSSFF